MRAQVFSDEEKRAAINSLMEFLDENEMEVPTTARRPRSSSFRISSSDLLTSKSLPVKPLSASASFISDTDDTDTEDSFESTSSRSRSNSIADKKKLRRFSVGSEGSSRSEPGAPRVVGRMPKFVREREVVSLDGEKVKLETIFKDKTVVLVLLRHFGW